MSLSLDPLTPAGLDLREFEWMPLDVAKLRDSDLTILASGDAFRAAVLLWCASWHQVPAGSLPKEDRLLANLAGYGRDLKGWMSVRTDALHGFVECSDGRYYHPLICQKAIEADEQRNKQRKRTAAATSAIRGKKRGGNRNDDRDDYRNGSSDGPRNEDHLTLPDRTEPYREREKDAPAPAKRLDSGSGKGQSGDGTTLTLDFSPSPPCRETIEAMGFADAQFNSEFSKFVAYYMARGYRRADWNAALISWFQRATPEAKPSAPAVDLAIVNKVFVVEGTLEWTCWSQHWKETRGVGWSRTIARHDEHGHIQNGWWRPTRFPPGYDEATGERLEKKDDAA